MRIYIKMSSIFFSYNYSSQSITNLYEIKPFSYVLIYRMDMRTYNLGTSLLVQWLRIHAPSVGGLGLIPCQGTRSHLQQLEKPLRCNEDPGQPKYKFF